MANPTKNIKSINDLLTNQKDTARDITNEYKFQRSLNEEILKKSKDFIDNLRQKQIGQSSIVSLLEKEKNVNIAIGKLSLKQNSATQALNAAKKRGNTQKVLAIQQQIAGLNVQLNNLRLMKAHYNLLNKIASNWGFIISFLATAFGWFRLLDEAASDFRIRMGMWEDTAMHIQNVNKRILSDLMHAGVQIDDIYYSTQAVGESFGSVHYASREITSNLAYWQRNLGVAARDGAELLRVFSAISGTTYDSQISMGNFLQKMTSAAGVPLNDVIKDIAAASKSSYSMLSKTPLVMMKAAVEARRLGSSLDAMAKSGQQLLHFTDSINEEMNASVLLGRAVNLQRARELAYHRDQVGFQKEIIRLATEEFDFNKMDYFQQQAFAKALGKSADEISKIIAARNTELWIMTSGTKEQREQLENLKTLESMNESMAASQGESANKMMLQRANQAKLVQLQNTWNQLIFQLGEVFIPIIDASMKLIIILTKIAGPFIKVGVAAWGVFKILKGITFVVGLLVSKLLPSIAPIFGTFSSIALRLLGPLGLIVSVVVGIVKSFDKLREIWNSTDMNWGQKILAGLKAVGNGIFDALVGPFIAVFEFLNGLFLGNSPSKIGLMIVSGLKSVGSMIFSNLINPFKMAKWAIGKLFGGEPIAASIETPNVDVEKSKETTTKLPVKQFDSIGVDNNEFFDDKKTRMGQQVVRDENRMENTEKLLSGIINSINGLRNDLTSGKVATNIDSQLVSTVSYRQTLFRKGYGTNQAVV